MTQDMYKVRDEILSIAEKVYNHTHSEVLLDGYKKFNALHIPSESSSFKTRVLYHDAADYLRFCVASCKIFAVNSHSPTISARLSGLIKDIERLLNIAEV